MKLSELEQEILDLDWLGTDKDGALARFMTGGRGLMPPGIADTNARHRSQRRTIDGIIRLAAFRAAFL